jgi:transposase
MSRFSIKSGIYKMDHFTSKLGGTMVHIEFTDEEIDQLKYERFNHPHPRVLKKMEALLLKSQNLPHSMISKIIGISSATLWRYLLDYKEGGIEKLKEINFYKPESDLMAHKVSIENYFKNNPPQSIPEAMKCIEELTGIKRSPTQIGQFLKRIGMKRLKTGMMPAKADPEVQEEFVKKN